MLLQSRQFCTLAVSSLQSLLSEPLLIANMSEKRAIAGSKHAGLPQTCQAASKHAGLAFEHLSPKRKKSACDRLQKEHCRPTAWNHRLLTGMFSIKHEKPGKPKPQKKGDGWMLNERGLMWAWCRAAAWEKILLAVTTYEPKRLHRLSTKKPPILPSISYPQTSNKSPIP